MKVSLSSLLIALLCVLQYNYVISHNDESSLMTSLTKKIKHVIVLMLENRSFDHMLGFLKKQNSDIDGCLPDQEGCSNSYIPNDPSSGENEMN